MGQIHFEVARKKSLETLRLMIEHGVPPTPENYAVWYAYIANSYPLLTAEMQRLLATKGINLAIETAELYGHFFGDMAEWVELSRATVRVEAAVNGLVQNVEEAGAGAERYGQVLNDLSGRLTHARGIDPEDVPAVLAIVVEETARMSEANRTLESRLQQSVDEIAKLRTDLEDSRKEALLDPLTGLANRKAFDRELRQMILAVEEHLSSLAVLMLDIDHFKTFNDTWGHQTGDMVLMLVARTMIEAVGTAGMASRLGGEEFAVLLPGHDLDQARRVAEVIRHAVGTKVLHNRRTDQNLGTITLSVGVSEFVAGEPATLMLDRADAALYWAKRNGRNRVSTELDCAEDQETQVSAG